MNLITFALCAPLVAVLPDERHVQHAATMDALVKGWDRTEVEPADDGSPRVAGLPEGVRTACGRPGGALLQVDGTLVLWPVRVSTLPDGVRRCRECYAATGRPKIRSELVAR